MFEELTQWHLSYLNISWACGTDSHHPAGCRNALGRDVSSGADVFIKFRGHPGLRFAFLAGPDNLSAPAWDFKEREQCEGGVKADITDIHPHADPFMRDEARWGEVFEKASDRCRSTVTPWVLPCLARRPSVCR
jgi:hypothetical protein